MNNSSENVETLIKEFDSIVSEVEQKVNYHFSHNEVCEILSYSVRKCEVNGKCYVYVPVLFKNELMDYVMRLAINVAGYINRLKKQNMEVTVNV